MLKPTRKALKSNNTNKEFTKQEKQRHTQNPVKYLRWSFLSQGSGYLSEKHVASIKYYE